MKLIFTGRSGAGLCDWDSFALLRDNVQHYIEGGSHSGRFPALHCIASAVDCGSCSVDAVRLRLEILQAWDALWPIPVEKAAVSTRTQAVRDGHPIPTSESVTMRVSTEWLGRVLARDEHQPLPKAAQAFVTTILSLTKSAVAGDKLQVLRMPSGPRTRVRESS